MQKYIAYFHNYFLRIDSEYNILLKYVCHKCFHKSSERKNKLVVNIKYK